MELLRGQQREALIQIEPHLIAEDRQSPCSGPVLLLCPVVEQMPHQSQILLHKLKWAILSAIAKNSMLRIKNKEPTLIEKRFVWCCNLLIPAMAVLWLTVPFFFQIKERAMFRILQQILSITFILFALFLFGPTAGAQSAGSTAANITGTVVDLGGAIIPGAHITAKNLATNLVRETNSDEDGSYLITQLPPG